MRVRSLDTGTRVVTAGAYVWIRDRVPFMIGPSPRRNRLAVVRLGGHREPWESPWQCAEREVREEAAIEIAPIRPPATYWLRSPDDPRALDPASWPADEDTECAPVLVFENSNVPGASLSVMYLARSTSIPAPSAEARGLLLLSSTDIVRIASGPVSLDDYRSGGGQALLRDPYPGHLILEPLVQLRVLAHLLELHLDLPHWAGGPA